MSAMISPCGQYRYLLEREAESLMPEKATACFIMLNPSTADGIYDDATIRQCRRYAKLWDCNGIVVVNLYALRATDPSELWKHSDPVGPGNDAMLYGIADEYEDVICAWGANAKHERAAFVVDIFATHGVRMWCLGRTRSGMPRHPLYLPVSRKLEGWSL